MSENVNNAPEKENPDNNQERMFTQEQLTSIIGQKIYEERAKYADYDELKEKAAKYDEGEEARKTELQKANEKIATLQKELDGLKKAEKVRQVRTKVSEETGVPAELLTGETEEDCITQAKAINDYAKPDTYPKVRDGGEVGRVSGSSTRDQFAEWFGEQTGN